MKLALSLDLDQLPADESVALQKLLDTSGLFQSGSAEGHPGMRDGFQYNITIEMDDQQHSFQAGDPDLSDGMRMLVNELVMLARSN